MSDFFSIFPTTITILTLLVIIGLFSPLIIFYIKLVDRVLYYQVLFVILIVLINTIFLATCVDVYSPLIKYPDLAKEFTILYSLYLPVGFFIVIPLISVSIYLIIDIVEEKFYK